MYGVRKGRTCINWQSIHPQCTPSKPKSKDTVGRNKSLYNITAGYVRAVNNGAHCSFLESRWVTKEASTMFLQNCSKVQFYSLLKTFPHKRKVIILQVELLNTCCFHSATFQ